MYADGCRKGAASGCGVPDTADYDYPKEYELAHMFSIIGLCVYFAIIYYKARFNQIKLGGDCKIIYFYNHLCKYLCNSQGSQVHSLHEI